MVKQRDKCGQLWTLGIEECLWSWGSPRLIVGILGTEGVQNGVSSERKGEIKRNKKFKRGGEKKQGKEERRKKEKEGEIL